MPPHRVVHVAVERCLVLAGSIAPDPHGARADEHPGGPDQLHGRRRRDHVSCLVHPVQAPQRDPSSTPFAPGKPISPSLPLFLSLSRSFSSRLIKEIPRLGKSAR